MEIAQYEKNLTDFKWEVVAEALTRCGERTFAWLIGHRRLIRD